MFTLGAPVTVFLFLAATLITVLRLTGALPVDLLLGIYGPAQPLDPGFWLRLVSWPLPHESVLHLQGNFVLILLICPMLEQRFGSAGLFALLLVTALAGGLAHVLLSDGILIGASGLAFMAIMLLSLSTMRGGRLPVTFVLVVVLVLGPELVNLVRPDTVSQLAHLVGGAMGIIFGLGFRGWQAPGSAEGVLDVGAGSRGRGARRR